MTTKKKAPKKRRFSKLGHKVHAILEARGLTQSVLADLARVNRGHLNRMMTGARPWSIPYIESIARALEIRPEELTESTDQAKQLLPNADRIERDLYEQVLRELTGATTRVRELEAELAGVNEALRLARGEVTEANARAAAAEDGAGEARSAANSARALAKIETTARAAAEASLRAAQQDAKAGMVRERLLLQKVEGANKQITVNFDAWKQAEGQRQLLAQKVQSSDTNGFGALIVGGLMGLAAGVAATPTRRR